MDVRITARHCQVSSGLEKFIREKIAKLEKFMSRLHDAHVVVANEHGRSTVEMTVGWTKGQQFTAHAEADNAKTAISRAQDKVEKQVRRLKARLLRRRDSTEAA